MQLPSTLATSLRPSATAAFALLGRLTQALPTLPADSIPLPIVLPGTLTPEMIRATLLEMGVAATPSDVALAETLAQIGLPLTAVSLAEASAAMARSPGALPQAYALAKSLGLPTTPDGLKALTAVLTASKQSVPTSQELNLDADTVPAILARQLGEHMLQGWRGPIPSLADGLSAHLEGQFLLNQASLQAHAGKSDVPLYLAVPLMFGSETTLAEMRLWAPQRREELADEEERSAQSLRVTLRLTPPRLGRVQADLTGQISGSLNCRLGVEKAASQRLLSRNTGALAEAFSAAGWTHCEVRCQPQSAWPALWHGGEAFLTPRTCVDRHV